MHLSSLSRLGDFASDLHMSELETECRPERQKTFALLSLYTSMYCNTQDDQVQEPRLCCSISRT